MAEGLFTKRIKDLNLDNKIYVESRATSSWEVGNSIHEGTKNILDQYEIDSKHMRAKQITNRDFETFDYIIGMDQNNVDTLISMNPNYKYKVYLYLDICVNNHKKSIFDPYYTHDFKKTYDDIILAMDLWINKFINDIKN